MDITDIHPLDVAEMLMRGPEGEELTITSVPDPELPGSQLTVINGTVYRQTCTTPRKGNTIV